MDNGAGAILTVTDSAIGAATRATATTATTATNPVACHASANAGAADMMILRSAHGEKLLNTHYISLPESFQLPLRFKT